MKLKIREASLQDLPELTSLFVDTIHGVCHKDYDLKQREVWAASVQKTERWEKAIKEQYFLVAETDGNILGFASLLDDYYIDFMYVHAKFQREGIASKLFEELLKEGVRKGTKKLFSDVSITARPFFGKRGFKVIRKNSITIDQVEISNFHMSLNI